MSREHLYRVEVERTGNRGSGTSDYRAYERAHEIRRESHVDRPQGTMAQADDLSGRFMQVTLRPSISIADAERLDRARELHVNAHRMCFIANSVNFPVTVEPDFER